MARVFIDPHMFSETWFIEPLAEMMKSKSVVFVHGSSLQHQMEISRVRKALAFYKQVGELRTEDNKPRRLDTDTDELERHVVFLKASDCFARCRDCDDPHIFALVYAKPTEYVFSMDMRMARCRDEINKHLDKRYCGFIVLASLVVYLAHKPHITSP